MKLKALIILIYLLPFSILGQLNNYDSLHFALTQEVSDSITYRIYKKLTDYFNARNRDSALFYADKCLTLASRNEIKLEVAKSFSNKAFYLMHLGKYRQSYQCVLNTIRICEDRESEKSFWELSQDFTPSLERLSLLANSYSQLGLLMDVTSNHRKSINFFNKAIEIFGEIKQNTAVTTNNLGRAYFNMGDLDSALLICIKSEQLYQESDNNYWQTFNAVQLGEIYLMKGKSDLAKSYFRNGIEMASMNSNYSGIVANHFGLTNTFLNEKNFDSALYYGKKSLEGIIELRGFFGNFSKWDLGTAYVNLSGAYTLKNDRDSAHIYMKLALISKDSIYKSRLKSLSEFQDLLFSEQLRLQELEQEKLDYRDRIRILALSSGILLCLVFAGIFYRNASIRKRANRNIEKAYNELKSAQKQMIQQEKMVSLGELTAGIAHEIQNPLNFVNNFTEVNRELISELKNEIEKGNIHEAKNIVDDIDGNEEKILTHGQRADAIVKSMLQHSRVGSGKKEPTDINALADEYLRLAYHGMRAKDKIFNAALHTDFDDSLEKANVIPQDIGRVILNLLNNAFYAVHEKKQSAPDGYEPAVSVSTKKTDNKIVITVKDNGNGIPDKIKDKIFQPFFTTKPTGKATGLGLSLSYDMVKAHGGEIKVESKEGEGSEFNVVLPVNNNINTSL